MPPRDAVAEAQAPVLEQPKALELVGKAMEEKGPSGVLELAKHEADQEISGIHQLGSLDPSVTYSGAAEDVLKMKAANESAVKQVQEAQHALELDLSEFGEVAAEVKPEEISPLRSAPVEMTKEKQPPVEMAKQEPAPVEMAKQEPAPVEMTKEVPTVIEAPKTELQQALEETHALISEQSGINPMLEQKKTEELGQQFDQMMEETDPMAEEMARLTETDREITKEKKSLQEFVGDKSSMTPLEQKYADSMQAHILYLVASAELSKAIIANKSPEEIAKLKTQTETAAAEATKLAQEYDVELKRYMNVPADEPTAEEDEDIVTTMPQTAAQKPATSYGAYPEFKGGSELKPREPGAFSKLMSKAWKSMKFWEVNIK